MILPSFTWILYIYPFIVFLFVEKCLLKFKTTFLFSILLSTKNHFRFRWWFWITFYCAWNEMYRNMFHLPSFSTFSNYQDCNFTNYPWFATRKGIIWINSSILSNGHTNRTTYSRVIFGAENWNKWIFICTKLYSESQWVQYFNIDLW